MLLQTRANAALVFGVVVLSTNCFVFAVNESTKHIICVEPEATSRYSDINSTTITWFQRQFYEWSTYGFTNLLRYLLQNSTPFNSLGINRIIGPEESDPGELEVYLSEDTCASRNACYELIEPLYLALGETVQHVEDYAYRPVVGAAVSVQSTYTTTATNTNESTIGQEGSIEESLTPRNAWWQWWIPWKILREHDTTSNSSSKYKMNDGAFAGGSHGEVWRGRRKCFNTVEFNDENENCSDEPLIFKRLKVEKGFRILEAGLREIHFGKILRDLPNESQNLFTKYIEHFFGNDGELWIVYADHGLSLRSFLYTAADAGDYVVFQQSWLWTLMRASLHAKEKERNKDEVEQSNSIETLHSSQVTEIVKTSDKEWKNLIRTFLKQILESVKVLHENGIVHRDIKPSNIICKSNIALDTQLSPSMDVPQVKCVLGDFSSAYDSFTRQNLYTRGPSQLEQTNEYAPPEAIFGYVYNETSMGISTSFDVWSIGIVALEILLGTPNVFSVDQRTRMVLSYKMRKMGASEGEIERAIYLAALSQFCIYNPYMPSQRDWPLRDGDPLHQSAMTKQTCTMTDFHRALRARDPLGWGFAASDTLLHLIWQLLAWHPEKRISVSDALKHPFFTGSYNLHEADTTPGDHNALESQMLDPRMDFNASNAVSEFVCPQCGRKFSDWKSCHMHTNYRKHSKFCVYDHSNLPTCLNSHAMLPAHSYSGYCDIQGRRPTIEDFHAIHLHPKQQFYGIFDGHLGNFAAKYTASFLYQEISSRLQNLTTGIGTIENEREIENKVTAAFEAVHEKFLAAVARVPRAFMDQSGTTATALLVSNNAIIVMSLGDSRAVMSTWQMSPNGYLELISRQLTKDHVAADDNERKLVESRGGQIILRNGMNRVLGSLIVTRSIGDSDLARYLSRIPQVITMTKTQVLSLCGSNNRTDSNSLCFLILASDGLWDTVSNQEAVDMVDMIVEESKVKSNVSRWQETAALQQAAEALTHEAYVRGSTDNIGVCIVAISD